MIDPTSIRQAREVQAALAEAAPGLSFVVYATAADLLDVLDPPPNDDLVCIVEASNGVKDCRSFVSRPLIEHEPMDRIVRLVLPEIRWRLRP